MQHNSPEDWVLATGNAISVREFATKVFEKLGIQISWENKGINEVGIDQNGRELIKVDSKYFRPTEVPHLLGDASKAKKLLGWKPTYTLESLIDEMVTFEVESTNL
jgi:GDPmannose 4,6-dehydratase